VGARVAGLGAARPLRRVAGADLISPFGKDAEWLRVRTGIDHLYRLGPEESLVDLATTAGADALSDALVAGGVDGVDAVVAASCSWNPREAGSLAAAVAAKLVPDAVSFDVNAACAGFCYGLSSASALVSTGVARSVLVIGAEQMSRLIDPADLGTSILFADGAGAAVVVADDDGSTGIGAPAWNSDATNADVLTVPAGEGVIRMRGSEVFRWAVSEVPAVAEAALANAGVTAADIDVFVPHQANLRIVEAVASRLGLSHAVVATDVVSAGNTSAASIPMALVALRQRGQVRSGQLALLVGFGAGLTIAAQVIRLP
jgi:3-oxoacyl-[acyl-carrier-protein] synthase III